MAQTKKVDCKYGVNCYQKNPEHHAKYNHPWKQKAELQLPGNNRQKRSPSPDLDPENNIKRQKKSRSKSPQQETPSADLDSRGKSPDKADKASSLEKSPHKTRKKTPESDSSTDSKESLEVDDGKQRHSTKSPAREKFPRENREHQPGKSSPQEEHLDTESCDEKGKPGGSKEGYSNQEKLREMAERKEMDITKEYKEVMENLSKSNYFEIFQRRVRYSKKAEYQDLLKTPEFIRHKFLVEMPSDFYKFWEFCESVAKSGQKPQIVFEKFGLKLVGPFDYLAGKFHEAKICEPGDYLRHWRFYYDPPEFQTIFVMTGTEVHYGYWRDDPKDKQNLLVARNDSRKGCEFEFVGGNCFESVLYFLDKDCVVTPFNRGEINNMKKRIQQFAKENDVPLNSLERLKKDRNSRVVCKTFHKAGLVVPFNRKTQVGYRNLIESNANLKKILSRFEEAHGDKKTNISGNGRTSTCYNRSEYSRRRM